MILKKGCDLGYISSKTISVYPKVGVEDDGEKKALDGQYSSILQLIYILCSRFHSLPQNFCADL
jgi:hypothetical protein